MIDSSTYNFGMTATGNGLGLHGPAAFTNSIMPQALNSPNGFQTNGQFTTTVPAQQHSQFIPNGVPPFNNYMNYMPAQQPYGMQQNYAPPVITPEVFLECLETLV
jgi:hypothetical protein